MSIAKIWGYNFRRQSYDEEKLHEVSKYGIHIAHFWIQSSPESDELVNFWSSPIQIRLDWTGLWIKRIEPVHSILCRELNQLTDMNRYQWRCHLKVSVWVLSHCKSVQGYPKSRGTKRSKSHISRSMCFNRYLHAKRSGLYQNKNRERTLKRKEPLFRTMFSNIVLSCQKLPLHT